MKSKFFKVIACEIAFREICHVASKSPNVIDLEFVTQGLHDTPCTGVTEIQRRIQAVPAGRYDAILIGYGLCGNIIKGLQPPAHTQLVVPRAHDCITFFLGSRDRYQKLSEERTGTYFYTSGWLECIQRRGLSQLPANAGFLPTRAGTSQDVDTLKEQWIAKFGEENASYLLETMNQWTQHYTHGALIDFDFTQGLGLDAQVQSICTKRGWSFEAIQGDLGLLQRWVDGQWEEKDFLVVNPGKRIEPSYDGDIIEEADSNSQYPVG